ncbi:MAG: MATE family efflux transporter [Clostridia bacterium]|nr:MATE family efflux transporter [Clostridia bacterium]
MKKTLTGDFTTGSIPKQLFWFMLPFMASNALQVLYSTIDMIIVGRYVGTAGLSAVAQSSQLINFATMVCLGVANAGQVLVSQALGSGKREKLDYIVGTLFSILMILAVIFTVIILLFKAPVLSILHTPAESFKMAKEYLVICGCGMVFTAGYNMVSAVLRGMGDSKRPFLFIVIASVTNLVLDILFTGILGYGVAGAAWATVIGQAVSFLFSIYYLYKNRDYFGFTFKKESFIIDKAYAGMIIKLGAPMAVQSGFINISMLFVNSIVNQVGVVASATFGVGVRIDDIINKICMGIQYGALPMISQNIGAGEKKRAVHVVYWAWVYSAVLTVFFMILYLCFGKELFMLFSDDVQVHEMSGVFIRAILWMFPAFSLMRGSGAFIQGIGHARMCMVLALLDGVVLRIGLSYLFGIVFHWGFYGIVLGYALAPYGYAVPSMIYFLSGKWKKRKSLAEKL